VNLLNEQADSNQQGMQSLLSGFLDGGGSAQQQSTCTGGSGIGDMLST
jgi:hypothetical protein